MAMSRRAVVIPSATVLLLRDGCAGLEVFMVVRRHEIDSFSGALVFPGGKLDPADRDPALRSFCRNGGYASEDLAFRVAAIREAYEECGVLLARRRGGDELIDGSSLQALAHYRRQLLANAIDMLTLCRAEGLELAVDRLQHYAHWITPKIRPKQFDTHFFLAPAPLDQLAAHDQAESLDSMWITPQRAVREAEKGRLTVVFPTRMNLLKLARSASLAQAFAAAAEAGVVSVQPQVESVAEGYVMTIPERAGYAASRILVPSDGKAFTVLG